VGEGRRHAGITLRDAHQAFIATIFNRLAGLGFDDLRPAHGQVFQHLKEDGTRLTALARSAGVTAQSMGALVDDLERRGYVERTADPDDRRAWTIRPTARGRAEVHAAREVIADLEAECASIIGDKRYDTLIANLEELNRYLRRLHGATVPRSGSAATDKRESRTRAKLQA